MQRIFSATMNDALRLHRLPAAQRVVLNQQCIKALLAQLRVEPEPGNAAADDGNVSV